MKKSAVNRLDRLERATALDDYQITLIVGIVARGEDGELYYTHGYKSETWNEKPREYLPPEYFAGRRPEENYKPKDPLPENAQSTGGCPRERSDDEVLQGFLKSSPDMVRRLEQHFKRQG